MSMQSLSIFFFSFNTGVIAFNNNHMPNTDDPLALFDKIYVSFFYFHQTRR